ncbi:MAG: hypothetical protein IPK33_33380 [Gemmatimonadetes bacterium]|nr:hypothetical protein [Gemmatimonadota bacterium]
MYYLTNFANYVHERPFLLLIPLDGSQSWWRRCGRATCALAPAATSRMRRTPSFPRRRARTGSMCSER